MHKPRLFQSTLVFLLRNLNPYSRIGFRCDIWNCSPCVIFPHPTFFQLYILYKLNCTPPAFWKGTFLTQNYPYFTRLTLPWPVLICTSNNDHIKQVALYLKGVVFKQLEKVEKRKKCFFFLLFIDIKQSYSNKYFHCIKKKILWEKYIFRFHFILTEIGLARQNLISPTALFLVKVVSQVVYCLFIITKQELIFYLQRKSEWAQHCAIWFIWPKIRLLTYPCSFLIEWECLNFVLEAACDRGEAFLDHRRWPADALSPQKRDSSCEHTLD